MRIFILIINLFLKLRCISIVEENFGQREIPTDNTGLGQLVIVPQPRQQDAQNRLKKGYPSNVAVQADEGRIVTDPFVVPLGFCDGHDHVQQELPRQLLHLG